MSAAIPTLILCLLVLGPVPATAEDHFLVTPLAPDLLMLGVDEGSYSTNSLVFTGKDGLLLVDTQSSKDAEALKTFVDGLGFGSPKYIINTHRHVEHIGGNALFGPDPIIVAHHLFPERLRSKTSLFTEYPPDVFPDITFADSMEIRFNDEIIRLVDTGGSHDDNEIMVHFTQHGIAHVSSVVNGFCFPSVDSDGDVLQFAPQVHRLMTLLPRDVCLVSGHNGWASGFDFVGRWDQLPAYADMMESTVEIVRQGLAEGKTMEDMQAAGVLDDYKEYAGSYVSTDKWIQYVVNGLTRPRETGKDVCQPVYHTWKKEGARAAVERYRQLKETREQEYDFHENILLRIGSRLCTRGLYEDASEFLLGCIDLYPDAEYTYYSHYLTAQCFHELDRQENAIEHCRESLRINPDFDGASAFLEELSGESGAK
jgi:glyoxylase-like metal-dependent hydrolase (beta-lactamase superfamily II)